jgi:hypothetical protein
VLRLCSAYLEFKIFWDALCLAGLCRGHSKGEHYDSEEASEIERGAHSLEPTIRDEQAAPEHFWKYQPG